MDDDVQYVYVEDGESGNIVVWPLEDSGVRWGGKPVLTKSQSHIIEAAYCDGYQAGNPGYYQAVLDGDPPEICEVRPGSGEGGQIPSVVKKARKRKIEGVEVEFPETWAQNARDAAANNLSYLILGVGTAEERLCWAEGSVKDWLAKRAERREQKKVQQEQKKIQQEKQELDDSLKELHDSGTAFINPYTFVPLPERVRRAAPSGHARAAEGALTGYVDVEYKFKTSLMLPGDWSPAGGGQNGHTSQHIEVPGSTVRGSVRSLYEVLTDSCLHVIDPDYLPVHRSGLTGGPEDRLAIVHETDGSGRVAKVMPTSKVIWAKAGALQRRLGRGTELKSGLRVDLEEAYIESRDFGRSRSSRDRGKPVSRLQLRDEGISTVTVSPNGAWVIHVADAGTKGRHPFDHIYVALGKLGDKTEEIPAKMWEEFRELCRHSADVDAGKLADKAPAWNSPDWPEKEVLFKGQKVGLRRKTDGMLAVGDSVWLVRDRNERTIGLKMSYSWRELGKHPLRERLPDASLLPCSDPGELCPACRVFGFVEQRTSGSSRESRQNAYGSHIRFLKFRSDEPVEVQRILPPPMRSPRASAGAFYLLHDKTEDKKLRQAGTPKLGEPSSRWGGPLDAKPRRIAGRKFYWHGQEPDETKPTPRHLRRSHYPGVEDKEAAAEQRWFAPAGTRVRGRVLFENLRPEEVGFLLMALNPQLLGRAVDLENAGELATHLGGGKGLGYGSAVVSSFEVHLEDAASRYLAESTSGAVPDEETVLQAAIEEITKAPQIAQALAKALGTSSVPADRIWYPTTGDFNKRHDEEDQKRFDKSFEYYARFSGGQRERGSKQGVKAREIPMRTLPRIDDPNQYMSNEPDPDKEQK